MKLTFTLLLLSLLTCGFGQNSKLTVYNPAPRVGDEIEVTITLKKENLEQIESKKTKTIKEFNMVNDNFRASGKLKFSRLASEPGVKTIGPFIFNFDGHSVSTDSIELTIYPALPDSVKDGIWIRNVEFNSDNYLLIEQRLSDQWKRESNGNSSSLSHGGDGVTYALLDKDKFKSMGLEISNSSSSSSSQIVDEDDIFGSGTVSYRIATFKYNKTEDFKKFKLSKKFFSDLPPNYKLEEIWIE